MKALEQEAQAFNSQIIERVKNGHIPDIRLTQPCSYFYNNSWRHPDYVQIDMGEQTELIHSTLQVHARAHGQRLKLLEVGCGPGWLSLEMARQGYDVVGLDLSADCITVAQQIAQQDPWKEKHGDLRYVVGDFFNSGLPQGAFDAVVFLGSLHHFADQTKVMQEVSRLLTDNGLIIAHEPTRDRMTEGNAAFIHLLRVLLSTGGGFYQQTEIPRDVSEHDEAVNQIYTAMKYEDQAGGNVQSVHDNDAGHKEMYSVLTEFFAEVEYQERYSFFHEIIGGLRYDQQTNGQLARYLRDTDKKLCQLGVLQPTEFFYTGRKKGS